MERQLDQISSTVTNITNIDGGDLTRFDYEYDYATDGVGVLPEVGDVVFYDPISQKVCTERFAKGSVGLSSIANPQDGNSTYRYALGKFDIIQTSDNKYWYAGVFGSSSLAGSGSPNFALKIWEIVEDPSGTLSFDFGAVLVGSISTVAVTDLSMSNIAAGAADTFGAVVGDVDTTANTITFVKMVYDSGTGNWTLTGGGASNDSSMGISHTNFDVRNGDLIYDPVQQEYLFFAVDSTNVAIERWLESTGVPQGVITLAGKTYTIDVPERVNGFNIATRLSDGNYLVLDGTSAGNFIYNYDGVSFTPTGTNSTTISFMDGFNGVQINEDQFVNNILLIQENETVSFITIEYDAVTSTLTQDTRQSTHNFVDTGAGRPFDTNKQSFFYSDIMTMFDINGNSIEIDSNLDIVRVGFSGGAGTSENMSVKPMNGVMFYYSDFADPSSSGVTQYTTYHWTVTQTVCGNLQKDRLPIELGTVSGVDGTDITVDCLLVAVEGTGFVQGEFYNNFIAISDTRAIQVKEGSSLPSRFPTTRVITDATLQAVLLSGYQQTQTINDNNILLNRTDDKQRYTFEVNKDANTDNVNFNIIVNGVPYFSERNITASQSWYYIDLTTAGSVFSNIAVALICRAYLYDL
jgi:hypothetical protein